MTNVTDLVAISSFAMSSSKKSGGKVSQYSSNSASEVVRQFPLHSSLGFRVTPNGCDIIGHFLHESIHPTDVEHIRWVDTEWQKYWDELSATVKIDEIPVSRLYDCGSQIEGSLVLKFDEINEALNSHSDHDSTLSKFFLPNKTAWSKLVNAINDDLTPQNTLIRENGEWTEAGSLIGELLARDPVTTLAEEVAAQEPVVEVQVPYDQYATSSEDEQEDPGTPGVDPLEEDGDWHPHNM